MSRRSFGLNVAAAPDSARSSEAVKSASSPSTACRMTVMWPPRRPVDRRRLADEVGGDVTGEVQLDPVDRIVGLDVHLDIEGGEDVRAQLTVRLLQPRTGVVSKALNAWQPLVGPTGDGGSSNHGIAVADGGVELVLELGDGADQSLVVEAESDPTGGDVGDGVAAAVNGPRRRCRC
jgi:hypothetical protein